MRNFKQPYYKNHVSGNTTDPPPGQEKAMTPR